MKTMNVISLRTLFTLTLITVFSPNILASDFGTIDSDTQAKWQQERVVELVGTSSDYRSSINKGRSIAGQTADELKWANEFETLMSSHDDKDYLEMSLNL